MAGSTGARDEGSIRSHSHLFRGRLPGAPIPTLTQMQPCESGGHHPGDGARMPTTWSQSEPAEVTPTPHRDEIIAILATGLVPRFCLGRPRSA